jgi:hypothetical protein
LQSFWKSNEISTDLFPEKLDKFLKAHQVTLCFKAEWIHLIHLSIAGVAQLVEHDLAKVGVAGSSLVSRSSFEEQFITSLFLFITAVVSILDTSASTKMRFI